MSNISLRSAHSFRPITEHNIVNSLEQHLHSVGYKGCSYYKTQVKSIKNETLDSISYASAVKRVSAQTALSANNNTKTNTNNYITEPPKPQRSSRTQCTCIQPKSQAHTNTQLKPTKQVPLTKPPNNIGSKTIQLHYYSGYSRLPEQFWRGGKNCVFFD